MPYRLARGVVEVRLTSSVVEVFFKNRRVAAHLRRYDKGRHSTEPAHMPDSHRRYLEWTPGRIVHWAEKNGPSTGAFTDELLTSRPHPEQGFRSALSVMGLAKKYGPQRLEAACERALALRSFSYSSVASMLKHGLDHCPRGPLGPTPCTATSGARTTTTRRSMLTHSTIEGLKTLRLPAMASGLLEQREHPDYHELSFEDRLGLLVERELLQRSNRRRRGHDHQRIE